MLPLFDTGTFIALLPTPASPIRCIFVSTGLASYNVFAGHSLIATSAFSNNQLVLGFSALQHTKDYTTKFKLHLSHNNFIDTYELSFQTEIQQIIIIKEYLITNKIKD